MGAIGLGVELLQKLRSIEVVSHVVPVAFQARDIWAGGELEGRHVAVGIILTGRKAGTARVANRVLHKLCSSSLR